jgi:hypothetical protein
MSSSLSSLRPEVAALKEKVDKFVQEEVIPWEPKYASHMKDRHGAYRWIMDAVPPSRRGVWRDCARNELPMDQMPCINGPWRSWKSKRPNNYNDKVGCKTTVQSCIVEEALGSRVESLNLLMFITYNSHAS